MLKEFKQTASSLSVAKAAGKEAKAIANTLIGQALYINKDGTLQDKVALQRYVAKEGEGFAHRQYVSKAKNILAFLAENESVTLKDGGEVTLAMVEAGSFDNLPSCTFSSVDAAIRAINKPLAEEESREKQALALGAEAEAMTLKEAKALSTSDQARLVQAGLAILDAQDAKAHLDGLAAIKHTIEAMTSGERMALVDFIATLEAGEQSQAA